MRVRGDSWAHIWVIPQNHHRLFMRKRQTTNVWFTSTWHMSDKRLIHEHPQTSDSRTTVWFTKVSSTKGVGFRVQGSRTKVWSTNVWFTSTPQMTDSCVTHSCVAWVFNRQMTDSRVTWVFNTQIKASLNTLQTHCVFLFKVCISV